MTEGVQVNLFWSTRRLTTEREDHLTEFVAAALTASDSFRAAYRDLLFANARADSGLQSAQIANVTTQVSFPNTSCCPDMILEMSNGMVVACEHKLDALETMGPATDSRPQLERYLDLPIDALVYIRSEWKPPPASTINHDKYISPQGREHFLWRDLYPLLVDGDHVLLDWLREGFERLGFTPAHPSIGEMSGPDDEQNKKNKRNFAKFWQGTRTIASHLGWTVGSGSIVELYMSANQEALADSVFVSPAMADRFLFRVTPKTGRHREVMDRLQSVVDQRVEQLELTASEVPRKGGREQVLDVTTSLYEILGSDELSAQDIESRLQGFIEPLLRSLQK